MSSLQSFLKRIGDVTIEKLPQNPEEIKSFTEMDLQNSGSNENLPSKDSVKVNEDDMDLDETIDSHIGVRMAQHSFQSENEEDDESVNILDTLPLEGCFI